MDSKKPYYKSKAFWVLVLFLLYSALGFFAVPYFIKKELKKVTVNELNSALAVDKVNFNPYTLTTHLNKLRMTDLKDEKTWLSSDSVKVNFSLIKTLLGNTHISEITLDNPNYFLLLTDTQDSSKLKYPQLKPTDNTSNKALSLDIDAININQGTLSYLDKSSDKIVEVNFKSVGFKQVNFTTDDKDSSFDLSLLTDNEDGIQVSGQLNLVQSKVSGSWQLNDFSTATLFKFISDKQEQFYGFQNQSGLIQSKGSYQYHYDKQSLPHLIIDTLALEQFNTQALDSQHPQISKTDITIKQADLDLDNKHLLIQSLNIPNAELSLNFDQDNRLIWLDNSQKQTADDSESTTQDNWQVQLNSIDIDKTQLILNHKNSDTSFSNDLLIQATIENLTNQATKESTFKLSVIANNNGQINLHGNLLINPLKVNSAIEIKQLQLSDWQAWIPTDIQLKIEQGELSLQQQFNWENNQYQSKGWVKVNHLKLLDKDNQTFLKISQLDINKNDIDSKIKTINLDQIKLDKAEGNLSVSSEKKLNISSIIADQQDKEKLKEKIKNTKDDWIINIKQIELIDLQSQFIDRSIHPNYQTKLSKINSKIKSLSSANSSKADVDINGVLDTYGKFSIKGQINPLTEKAYTDIDIKIDNIDLQNFSTYSSKYTGFPINRGKADFKLNYQLNQSLLKGKNDLEFKQLQLGNKIMSKDAINLPLKLAVSLLTDGKGIMAINLPVSGKVDDPDFSYGGLVFRAFFKLITGIVASPFKLLGKLIPNGANLDLSGIQFKAGSAEWLEGEESKLKAMQSILQKRPSILLQLSSSLNTIEDTKAIQQNLLLAQMKLDSVPELSDEASLKPIKKLYQSLFDKDKWQSLEHKFTQEGVLNHALLAESAWQELLQDVSQDAKNQLQILGKQRAQKIQQSLIEDYKIPQDRIFIKSTEESVELPPQVKFGIAS